MKINTISKLLETLNKTLPCKEYFKKAIVFIEKVETQTKGTKFDRSC